MRILFRPYSGRVLCGVAMAFAERYGCPLALIRFFFIASFLVSPAIALIYLLLAISIPSERKILSSLSFIPRDPNVAPRERFQQCSSLISNRTIGNKAGPAISSNVVGIVLLFFAAFLELPNVEGVSFYMAHPIVTTFANDISSIGAPLFYSAIGLLLLVFAGIDRSKVTLVVPIHSQFEFTRGSLKIVGGIVLGISEMLEIDPAYLRALAILLNFFTLGVAGVAYLIAWYLFRDKIPAASLSMPEVGNGSYRPSKRFQIVFALLFFLLAVIAVLTDRRIFFFNVSAIQSLVVAGLGFFAAWFGIGKKNSQLWIACGAAIFFTGMYGLALSIADIQLSVPTRLEIAEIIAALTALYFTLVVLTGNALRIGFAIAIIFGFTALLTAFSIVPPRYLVELYRFYTFFYPTIFAGIGLWIAFER